MIIEAGYDLCTLLFDGDLPPTSLRMVMLDSELRFHGTRTLAESFDGDLGSVSLETIDSAIPAPDHDDEIGRRYSVHYVALGYEVPSVESYPEGFDWGRVKAIEEGLSCRGIQLLGIQVSDGEQWASTGPIHSFESYALEERIPRVLIIPGPHPFLTCECAYCGPKREALERARSRRAADDVQDSV